MILNIKKILNGYKIIDDEKKETIFIKNGSLLSTKKNIIKDNSIIYKTDIIIENEKTKYVIKNKENNVLVKASLNYKNNNSIIKPPKVDLLLLSTPYGEWKIKQDKNSNVLISSENIVFGKITPFLTLQHQKFNCSNEFEIDFWAAMYVLCYYMVHEDDLITV